MNERHASGLSSVQGLGLMIVLGLLVVYGITFFSGLQETEDARKIETTQIALQSTLSDGITTLGMEPKEIHPSNIINAARTQLPKGIKIDPSLRMVLPQTHREAQFEITSNGDLNLVTIRNFTRYHVDAGRIVRNNHWGLSLSLP